MKKIIPSFSLKDQLFNKQKVEYMSGLIKNIYQIILKNLVIYYLKSLPKIIENWKMDNNFWDFIFCPYSDFVRKKWCNKKDLKFSLNVLEKMISNFSAEVSIRYFLNEFETETFDKMIEWSKSKNYHHRRL